MRSNKNAAPVKICRSYIWEEVGFVRIFALVLVVVLAFTFLHVFMCIRVVTFVFIFFFVLALVLVFAFVLILAFALAFILPFIVVCMCMPRVLGPSRGHLEAPLGAN